MADQKAFEERLVVIGGGAAGFFCAVNAARMKPGLKVILLEKSNKVLSKVKVSGGGRCNVAHACYDITEMYKRYPRGGNFVKKTFHQFFTKNTIEWFRQRNVEIKAEPDGRMFPVTDSSQTIIDCLIREANLYGVEILFQSDVRKVFVNEQQFILELANGRNIDADHVCIASGGYPKSSMFDWIKELGHTIEEPVPSLFTFNLPSHPITKLMGLSVENVRVRITGTKLDETGPLLVTHWGLSGPAVLKLSAWGARDLAATNWSFKASINWIPGFTEQTARNKMQELRIASASQKISGKNIFGLPNRMWEFLVDQSGIKPDTRWADLPSKEQNLLIKNLFHYEVDVKGKTTFKEEFVTAGGVKLSEIDANTMMSKKIPNLYFAGEILDVDGITGGYNFQHAWTSGYIAAKSITDSDIE